ncbi:glycosyltransferase family 4 protein [Candidatus Peregrinibacteria bacterium]|nr:glycosyltransferase family 4 protein [Candidatus Peregrinibacteria bacterium]
MKKILFYTDTPNYGGAEKQMELLAKHLRPLGYSVSLACGAYSVLKRRTDSRLRGNDGGVYEQTYLLPTIHKHDPRHYTQLKKLLKTGGFGLIHIHLWNPGSCRYAFWAAKHANIPIIATEHDPFELSGLKHKIKKMCLAKSDQIIAISLDNFRHLSNYGEHLKNRLNLIHNGIEADRFFDNHDKASLPVQRGDLVITCIAELHKRKGQKYLLQAFKKLQVEFPTLHLVLVGIGPEEKRLKEEYGNIPNIHFLGWREDIPRILKASDIFVLPSLREAFGLVVLEAMASGVIAVATDNGGTKDIIEHGKSGYLVPPANPEKLAEVIRTILTNPDQKRDIEKAALERVKTEFSAKIMAEKTTHVYEKALSHKQ